MSYYTNDDIQKLTKKHKGNIEDKKLWINSWLRNEGKEGYNVHINLNTIYGLIDAYVTYEGKILFATLGNSLENRLNEVIIFLRKYDTEEEKNLNG